MKKRVLFNLILLLQINEVSAQFSTGFTPDLREAHLEEFDFNQIIQACSEGGDYPMFESIYSIRFKNRSGIWSIVPELFHSKAFYGEKRMESQLDSLQKNGWSELDVAQARLIISLTDKNLEQSEKLLEELRKRFPDNDEMLRADIEFIFNQEQRWAYRDENIEWVRKVIERIGIQLSGSQCSESRKVYYRLAHYDLIDLINEKQFCSEEQLLDSLWNARPTALHPFPVWGHLHKSDQFKSTALQILRREKLEKPGEYWQALAILQNRTFDSENPEVLLQFIQSLPEEREQQIAKAIIYAQTWEKKNEITPANSSLSFLIPKIETPVMSPANRAKFRVNLPLEKWNILLQEVLKDGHEITDEQFAKMIPLFPETKERSEVLQLVFGSLMRLYSEAILTSVLFKNLTKDYAIQVKPPQETLTIWSKLYQHMEKQPNYVIKGDGFSFIYSYYPNLDEEQAVLFNNRDSLLAALNDLDKLAKQYPSSAAILHNKMTLITLNCITGNLATKNPDKELLRAYGEALIESLCLNKEIFNSNIHQLPPVNSNFPSSVYSDVLKVFSNGELNRFHRKLKAVLETDPYNDVLRMVYNEIEELLVNKDQKQQN